MVANIVSFAQTSAEPSAWPEAARTFAKARGITDEIIEREGWTYASSAGAYSAVKHKKPGILIPVRTFQGETGEHVLRVISDSGDAKYLLKGGTTNKLMVPAKTSPLVAQAKKIRLYLCESIVKAIALSIHLDSKVECAAGVNGVNGIFRERKVIKDVRALALEGRIVTVVFDSDWQDPDKWQVREATINTADALAKLGAVVRIVLLPNLPGHDKMGIDDFLIAKGGGLEQFRRLEAAALTPENEQFEGWRMHPVVEELNKKHAIVIVGASSVIARFSEVDNQRRVIFQKEKDFELPYRGYRVQMGTTDKDKPIIKSAAQVWLESPHHLIYDNVILDPALPPGGDDTDKTYNMWAGFKYDYPPPSNASWKLFRQFITDIICNGDKKLGEWVVTWMARCIQEPWKPAQVAIVLQGDEGIGKGIFARIFGALFGIHNVTISQQAQMTGKHNAHYKEALLVFCDEAFFAGDPRVRGPLMSMITEPTMRIEPKFLDSFEVPNLRSFIFASNEDMVVPAGLSARRWAFFRVSDRYQQDKGYFGRMLAEMDAGGYSAMLQDLRAVDITKLDPRTAPATPGLYQQKMISLKSGQQFWVDCIERGEYPASLVASATTTSAVGWVPWPEDKDIEVHCPAAQLAYLEQLQLHRASSYELKSHSTMLGYGLRDLFGEVKRTQKMTNGKKFWVWSCPSRTVAEGLISKKLGVELNFKNSVGAKRR